LRNIHAALKAGSRFILTALNACRLIRQATQEGVEAGRFDPLTMVEVSTIEWDTPQGKKSRQVRERSYVPTELAMLLGQAGFEVEHIWGGTAGDWGRRQINLDEMEIMVTATKAGELISKPLP
jgi:hypothetical protein